MKKVVILAAARTPIGSFLGSLAALSATELGSQAIAGVLKKANAPKDSIDEVIMGQVLQGGSGQAPARQASLGAGLPTQVPCTTVNKVCGSALKAIMLACDGLALGHTSIAVAGGMESMSQAPYILSGARQGFRMGHQRVLDLMLHDGLFDPYGQSPMGSLGDLCAREYGFSRQMQDEFAAQSYEKALAAQNHGYFDEEIIALNLKNIIIKQDEEPGRYQPHKVPNLKPSFSPNGTITPANASKISDGAAALLLSSEEEAQKRGLPIKATVLAYQTHAEDPQWFSRAPVAAIKKVLVKASLSPTDIGLYEINEAFSVVPMLSIKELCLDPKKVNILGGAIALGHPIGCSGARILVTLLNSMEIKNIRFGCAAICLGGGEALAMIVERAKR